MARINVFVAMSTHCASCKKIQPQFAHLLAQFPSTDVAFYGVGTDLEETEAELDRYAASHKPAYEVLSGLSLESRRALKRHVIENYGEDLTPVSVAVTPAGEILATWPGAPTVSQVKSLLTR